MGILIRMLLLGLLLGPGHATAESAIAAVDTGAVPASQPDRESIRVYKYRNDSGVRSFSDRAPMGRYYEVIEVVNAALGSQDRDEMRALAAALQEENDLGCPLG